MRCSARRLPWRLSRVVILRPEAVTAAQHGHTADSARDDMTRCQTRALVNVGETSVGRPGQGLARFVLDATWEGASQCAFGGFVLRTAQRCPTPVGAMRPRECRNV
jgi:hypothetical protein